MFGIELLRGAVVVGLLERVVVPDVAPFFHWRVFIRIAHYDHGLDRGHVVQELVDGRLDRRALALAAGVVGGDQRLGLGELHPLLDRVRGEAAEDEVVRGADPGAGQHGDYDLGDHRHVDPHHVALLDAVFLEGVGELLGVAEELGVGDVALLALLAAPVEGHLVALAVLHVAVEAVVGGVDLAAREPLVEGGVRVVERLVPAVEPVERLGLLLPPRDGVLGRLLVDRIVGDQRALGELLRRIE